MSSENEEYPVLQPLFLPAYYSKYNMVRISISIAVFSLSTCAMAFGIIVKCDAVVVLEDFKKVNPLVNGLINVTNVFPAEGGMLVQFLDVHFVFMWIITYPLDSTCTRISPRLPDRPNIPRQIYM